MSALKHFHPYLYGQEVTVRTDNAAVSWLRRLKDPCGQMARWLQYIESYHLKVIHRPGRLHQNADALSRKPCNTCARQEKHSKEHEGIQNASPVPPDSADSNGPAENKVFVVTRSKVSTCKPQTSLPIEGWTSSDLCHAQIQDPNIGPIYVAVENHQKPSAAQISNESAYTKTLWNQFDRLILQNGLLCRIWTSGDSRDNIIQIIVPRENVRDLLYHYHDVPSAAHLGTHKMIAKIRQHFFLARADS